MCFLQDKSITRLEKSHICNFTANLVEVAHAFNSTPPEAEADSYTRFPNELLVLSLEDESVV